MEAVRFPLENTKEDIIPSESRRLNQGKPTLKSKNLGSMRVSVTVITNTHAKGES